MLLWQSLDFVGFSLPADMQQRLVRRKNSSSLPTILRFRVRASISSEIMMLREGSMGMVQMVQADPLFLLE